MEVAFWELAPYFPGVKAEDLTSARMKEYIRNNAGRPFEYMLENVEADRKAGDLQERGWNNIYDFPVFNLYTYHKFRIWRKYGP